MLLTVEDIDTYYGPSQAVHGVSFDVAEREVVALLGRNGAGKSTTLRSIMGLTPVARGRIAFAGREIAAMSPHRIARLGLTLVPETRAPFSLLTVRENIMLGWHKSSAYSLERLLEIFPLLADLLDRKGNELSGGQQQLMVMARGLAMDPSLLLLDEPSQGLAPIMVKAVSQALEMLKHDGLTIVLVEQNLDMAVELADRIVVLENGAVADRLDARTARDQPRRLEQYLAVH